MKSYPLWSITTVSVLVGLLSACATATDAPESSDAPQDEKVAQSAEALRWGATKDDGCRAQGVRQYSAILWDIQGSWERACAKTSIWIQRWDGQWFFYESPARCRNAWGHMWGEWDVPDDTCM